MSGARFSRIVIIQSLPATDSPTGRQLRDAIESAAQFNYGIPVELIEARTENDFWDTLEKIRSTTEQYKDYPILHIECHGLSDKTGLSLGDGTALPWAKFATALTKLNQVTQCNLLVTLAACHGGMLFETIDVHARAPCWGLLGPSNEVSPPDLVGSYSSFFLKLLESQNTQAALCALRDSPKCRAHYFIFTAEDVFQKVFLSYRATCSTKLQMEERAERFAHIVKKHGMPELEKDLIGHLYNAEHDVLERFFIRFFFVDYFQENRLRFADAYASLSPGEF